MSDRAIRVGCVQIESGLQPAENLTLCLDYIAEATRLALDLVVFPESTSSRTDLKGVELITEPLDGPFVRAMINSLKGSTLTAIFGITEMNPDDPRPYNTIVAVRAGGIIAKYRKIHLYDAGTIQESRVIAPGDGPLEVFDVQGFSVGMINCYDIRFPEATRVLAERGADIVAVPTSWIRGPLKEFHWETFCASRAIENGVFLVGSGQTGGTRAGLSRIIAPDGTVVGGRSTSPGMIVTELSKDELESNRAFFPLLKQKRLRLEHAPLPHFSSTKG